MRRIMPASLEKNKTERYTEKNNVCLLAATFSAPSIMTEVVYL